MMGLKDAAYQVQGNWGQPEELQSDFDPASPLPHTTPAAFLATDGRPPRSLTQPRRTDGLSLYAMCLRVILRNISSVQDLGDMPYRNAKPILEECRIDQLILLEEASPHLLEHTDEIWKRNCLRDFIELRKKYQPPNSPGTTTMMAKEPKSWRRLYFRTKGEIEQAKVEAAQRIKDKYAQHRAEKDAKKLVVSDRPLMLKAARSGGRRFGITAGGGGASKGQSLMNKARSGSAAQAKLTAPRNGRFGFKTQGRSKAVGVEIASEAAGVEVRQMARPMVAPRRITGGGSEGLARMKEFSRPPPSEEGKSIAAASTSRRAAEPGETSRNGRQVADAAAETTGLPRLKPHEVAAAPPLTPSASSSGITPRSKAAHGHPTGSASTLSSHSTEAPSRRQPASPPPDIARTERRKLNFFSGTKPSSASTLPSSTSSSSRGASPLSPSTSGVEVRGMKRAHSSSSQSADATSSRIPSSSSGAKTVTSPPASLPTATSFFGSGGKPGGVRVVQAKRARVQEVVPRSSTSAAVGSASRKDKDEPRLATTGAMDGARPSPARQQSSATTRSPAKDERTARASSAAMSSVFAPSRSSPSKGRSGSGVSR